MSQIPWLGASYCQIVKRDWKTIRRQGSCFLFFCLTWSGTCPLPLPSAAVHSQRLGCLLLPLVLPCFFLVILDTSALLGAHSQTQQTQPSFPCLLFKGWLYWMPILNCQRICVRCRASRHLSSSIVTTSGTHGREGSRKKLSEKKV